MSEPQKENEDYLAEVQKFARAVKKIEEITGKSVAKAYFRDGDFGEIIPQGIDFHVERYEPVSH